MRDLQPVDHVDQVDRGIHASQLLRDPIYLEAKAKAKQEFIRQWLETNNRDVHLTCWAGVKALDEVDNQFASIIADGEVSAKILSLG